MAFFDWNHDGKKNYVDNAIEMMIIDDIEEEKARGQANRGNTSEWGAAYSGKQAYSKGHTVIGNSTDENAEVVFSAIKILWGIAAIGILLANVIGIFSGYVSWLGLVVSIIVLVLIIRSFKKKRVKKRKN